MAAAPSINMLEDKEEADVEALDEDEANDEHELD